MTVFTLGWQVFRRRVTDVLGPARVRRAARWSGFAAVVALVGMAVLEARLDWTGAAPVRSVAAMVLLALGLSEYVVKLGRSERARLAAESLDPAPETPARPTS
ncbi:hypothetical protein DEJ30_02060 [Curtobacterium sp. MCPF17_003]|nr:hypothetical protein DEJ30_02060 [Curtobacterium sp. MCPF17_003]